MRWIIIRTYSNYC